MIYHLTLILALQLAGEVIVRGFGWVVPGPVLGMVFFVILMMAMPKLAEAVKGTALGLLAHLSLLFIPAGVGVVRHIETLGADAWKILIVVILSTLITILVTVFAFSLAAKGFSRDD